MRWPDIRDLTLESLRSVVGVAPQDAHMLHDTIRANLLYARPSATERELIEACQAARIWELISSLPDGLDTTAGEQALNRFSLLIRPERSILGMTVVTAKLPVCVAAGSPIAPVASILAASLPEDNQGA
jgi:hypothetical protein